MKIILYAGHLGFPKLLALVSLIFLEPGQYFQMLNLLPFFSGYLCEDDDQGGRNVFWTPWIRAGLNLFWKIQGSENSVTQLYIYTFQPPETKNLETSRNLLHCKNVIFDNVWIILSENHPKNIQIFLTLITAWENCTNFLPCIVVLVKLPVKCLAFLFFQLFSLKMSWGGWILMPACVE